MRIDCPFCGNRDLSEFTYQGDAAYRRPAADASASAFYEAVYLRTNPAGIHEELWYHTYGCRSFLRVRRDTRTHALMGAEMALAQDPS